MSYPEVTVTAFFDLSAQGGDLFTLDSTTKGVLDSATYVLAGDIATDITSEVKSVSIRRGRDRQLDDITAGTATLIGLNDSRQLDPSYTSGAYYGNIRPGKRVQIAAQGVTVFDGLIDDIDLDNPTTLDSTVTWEIADALASLAAKEFDEWTTTGSQLPGARLTAALDRNEVVFPATRAFDTGTSTLQADNVSWGSNVLNYCQLVTKSDVGQLFASRTGVLTFYGRGRTLTGVDCVEFRDDGTGVGYSAVVRDYGTELLFNRVGVDREGGTQQTVTDATSIETYGVRSLSLTGLLMDSDIQSLTMAQALLAQFSNPQDRFASLEVIVNGIEDPVDAARVAGLDIGDVIRIVYTPNGLGDPVDQYCLIEGVNHLMNPEIHVMTFSVTTLSPGFDGAPLTLDSATLGVLDTNVLAF